MTPDDHTRAERRLREEYLWLRERLFGRAAPENPAAIELPSSDEATTGYRPKRDLILLYLPEANLEDFLIAPSPADVLETDDWPAWARELVHETIHEYQFKALSDSSTLEGEELYATRGPLSACKGHGVSFSSAVVVAARHLRVPLERLIRNL